jgi:hypothetical protein
MGFFDSEEKKYKKKSKEQVYKELEGKPTDTGNFLNYLTAALHNQIMSQYPKARGTMPEHIAALKGLANDMGINNINVVPMYNQDWDEKPTYLHKGESYDIDELPKEANPHSLTSFLGRFDPFRNEVPLTAKDRANDPIHYEPRTAELGRASIGLGLARDFRTGRLPAELADKDYNFRIASSADPRMTHSAFNKLNPQTLDEMITAPGTGKIRFKALQERLAKEKAMKDLINSAKEQVEDEEVEKLMKERK